MFWKHGRFFILRPKMPLDVVLPQFWQLVVCKIPDAATPIGAVGRSGCPPVCCGSGFAIRAIKHVVGFDERFVDAVCCYCHVVSTTNR